MERNQESFTILLHPRGRENRTSYIVLSTLNYYLPPNLASHRPPCPPTEAPLSSSWLEVLLPQPSACHANLKERHTACGCYGTAYGAGVTDGLSTRKQRTIGKMRENK